MISIARSPFRSEAPVISMPSSIANTRWNWREADRTKLTGETRDAVIVIDGILPADARLVSTAAGELADLVRRHCGGEVRAAVLEKTTPDVMV